MNNLYKAVFTKGAKVMTCELMAEETREFVKERAIKKGQRYGWGARVFPAHIARYGKIKFDHLNIK